MTLRASLDHPSHPPQQPWDGGPHWVLFQESAQPIVTPWLPLFVAALVGAAIAIGLIFGGATA